jgi:hypothetical protein
MDRHERNAAIRVGRAQRPAVLAGAVVCLILAGTMGTEALQPEGPSAPAPRVRVIRDAPAPLRGARLETLWIFDADFEDLTGDNAGWVSYDRSGFIGQTNYWHHDTIRLTEVYLGESTWWCGTYNECWRQPRGYGNNWIQYLERDFPLASWSDPGDLVQLEWDQRYAMERTYDYGYVDISSDGGSTWETIARYNNVSFQGAGIPFDWDHHTNGHPVHDISTYAGTDIRLRYRFESDIAYSSEDQYDNPQHSVKDGAWQLDNITIKVNSVTRFYDDSESGNMGWIHDDLPPSDQTGVSFFRGQYGIDFQTGYPFTCGAPPVGTWMYAAVDPLGGSMVDEEHTWLVSPPIPIADAPNLVAEWDMWVDLPRTSNDVYNLYLSSGDIEKCVASYLPAFDEEQPGWWYGGPHWGTWTDDWSTWTGNEWLAIMWRLLNDEPPEPGGQHGTGIFLDRQRVGVVQGDIGTRWRVIDDHTFHDWFSDDIAHALSDIGRVEVRDTDGIVSVYLLASNDGGATWEAYECDDDYWDRWWTAPAPESQIAPGSQILYYWEANDGAGNTSTLPENAPEETFEFSILPIVGSVEEPGILLVDKHGGLTAGEMRDSRYASEHYYREALDILGYDYDVYDFDYAETNVAKYPTESDMLPYDTQIWFANRDFDDPVGDHHVVHPIEEASLIAWLSQAEGGLERNLLLTGNEINSGLAASRGGGRDFLSEWLATEFLADDVGDTLPSLRDASFGFMTFDDRQCILAGGCPWLLNFDAVGPTGVEGSEPVAEYVTADRSVVRAGAAYAHPTMGYRTVNLGFGMEFMMDYLLPTGQYATGVADRVDLLGNVMDYFGKQPTGPGTEVLDEPLLRTALSRPVPNPSGPGATIAYGLVQTGHVTVRIYSPGGRLVATLVDDHLDAGGYRTIWDGTNDDGLRVASGIYFVRMETDGFAAGERLVLLK